MATNLIQIKRTSVTGRAANSTTLTNPGELALNMTDGIMYSTNGTSVFEVGANLTSIAVGNSTSRLAANTTQVTISMPTRINNNQHLRFQTVNSSAYAYMVQQNDDNFVFYTSNTTYGQRAVWSIFANTNTSVFDVAVPLRVSGGLVANGTAGTSGQVLKTNGTTAYWDTASGSGTVTSIATANGLSGGTITATGTLGVVTGSTLTVNTTGIHVNSVLSVDRLLTSNNGLGTNISIGDDAWFGDVNKADTVRVVGQQNPNNGYIIFGDANNDIKLGRAGLGPLTYNGDFTVTGSSNATTLSVGSSFVANSTRVVIGTAVGLQANGGIGTAGQVLHSNGTTAYWAADDGITSIATANGLSGGTITSSGTLGVTTGPTLTVNSTGIHVNTIATSQLTGDVALGTNTSGNYVATIQAGNGLAGNSFTEGGTPTIAVVAGSGVASNATGVHVVAGNGTVVSNTTGVYVNAAALSIATSQLTGDVALGANTSGNYVATISNANGISGSSAAEGGTPTIGVVTGSTLTVNTTGIHVNSALSIASLALSGDLNVTGNLTVSGTRTYVNTTTLDIGDNIFTLNADLGAVAPSQDAGIEIMRGTSANVQFIWDETNDRWSTNSQPLAVSSLVAAGALSGVTTAALGNTTITGFANVTSTLQVGATGSLGGTATNFVNNFTISTNNGNSSHLRFYTYRHTTGADWTGASTRIQQRIDATDMAYVEFNPLGYQYGVGVFGSSGKGFAVDTNGVTNYGANVVLGSSGLSANGGFGTAGHVLHSNGTATYWAADDGSVTSIATANGLTGGTITTTGTLGVASGSTLTVNTTGIHVNSTLSITSLTLAGALSGVTTAAMGNTTHTGWVTASSARGAVAAPTAGQNNSALYVTGSDTGYGLLFGTDPATGKGWIQSQRTDGTGTTYALRLNPTGGGVEFAGPASGITTLAAGNTTITGFANVSGTITSVSGLVYANNLLLQGDGTATYIRAINSGGHLYLGANNNNLNIVAANGNFGVGTLTPQYELDVNNGVTGANSIQASFGSTFSGGLWTGIHFGYSEAANQSYRKSVIAFERQDGAARGKIHILNNAQNGSDSATLADSRVTIQYDGNVGIGTTSPSYRTHIVGEQATSTTGFGVRTWNQVPPTTYLQSSTAAIGAGGTIGFGARDSGGTDYANWRIRSVFSAQGAGYGSNLGLLFDAATDSSGTSNLTNVLALLGNGNVGIGTSSPGAYKLSVNGTGYFGDDLTVNGGNVYTGTVADRVKYSVWDSSAYGIGMISGVTFGGIENDYAMTFQFNDQATRGFWWGDNAHTLAQGAMALTTDGKLTVAHSARIGFGESDTAVPGSTYALEVNGSFAATTKSFVIDHPTKPGMKLRYGSLEGPENGVYVRGRLRAGEKIIQLPDYWEGLVDQDTYTVNLTPVGKHQELYVDHIASDYIIVGGENIDCFYTVFAERNDVEKLEVEF